MKQLGRMLAVGIVVSALALMTGCSSQPDGPPSFASTAQDVPGYSESPAPPPNEASMQPQASSADQGSSGDSAGSLIWDVLTFPFRVVGDIVGFIL
ncbi:MAG TPA: hypothetical protein VMV27_08800 [Candidatus Binataceae bacterium]|nr:hypothetical protein [Candidatus Binataceae bacterium]